MLRGRYSGAGGGPLSRTLRGRILWRIGLLLRCRFCGGVVSVVDLPSCQLLVGRKLRWRGFGGGSSIWSDMSNYPKPTAHCQWSDPRLRNITGIMSLECWHPDAMCRCLRTHVTHLIFLICAKTVGSKMACWWDASILSATSNRRPGLITISALPRLADYPGMLPGTDRDPADRSRLLFR